MSKNDIYETFRIIREATEYSTPYNGGNTNQAYDSEPIEDAIPYTAQDTLLTNTKESAKKEFGADFNKFKNPMLYYPKDGDVTFSGIIPELNDAKFQFRYKVGDGAGCYVWAQPYFPISDKTLLILQKMNGVCKNWRDEIKTSEDYKPSNYRDQDDMENNVQGQAPTGGEFEETVSDNETEQNTPQSPIQEVRIRRGDDIVRHYDFRPGDDLD